MATPCRKHASHASGPGHDVSGDAVLFCPFCREPFEGLLHCPTHDLALVPFRELGPELDPARDQERLPLATPGFGRGLVLAGSMLSLLAFLLPLARFSGQLEVTNTMLELARGRDGARLWLVPLAALSQLVVLHRRRSLIALRGARLTVLVFALVPSLAVGSALFGVRAAAEVLSTRMGSHVELHIGVAAWLVWLAALPMLYGGAKLGVRPLRRVKQGHGT